MEPKLEEIYSAGLKFLTQLTPEETFTLIVEEAMRLIGAESGSILLEKKGRLERVYASSAMLYGIQPRKRGFMYNVYKSQKARVLTKDDIKKVHPEVTETAISSDIIIPLSYMGKSIGVLSVQSSNNQQFTDRDLQLLTWYAPMATLAIRKTELYSELQKALEIRDLFMSMASHELRTPLTSVNGYIQLLKNKTNGQGTQEAKWIEQLSWECLRLTNLVKELLETNRIKSGQLQYFWKECSLDLIISRAVENFKFTYPSRKIYFKDSLSEKESDLVIGDFDKLLQVFTNVVDNAIKFSPEDTEIIITLTTKGKWILIEIKDVGEGIAKKDLSRLFDSFYKAEGNLKQGMGLGLYLAKNIIDQHHGTIKLYSKVKKGTLVEIKLPKMKKTSV